MSCDNSWIEGFVNLALAAVYQVIYEVFYTIGYYLNATLYTLLGLDAV